MDLVLVVVQLSVKNTFSLVPIIKFYFRKMLNFSAIAQPDDK